MTVLDDARRMVEAGAYYYPEEDDGWTPKPVCKWCGRGSWGEDEHAPGCPWLVMPKIVAVLEVADQIVVGDQFPGNDLVARLRSALEMG